VKRPFSIFTAEDFALEVDGPYELTKAERQAVADRANAILNERGTRVACVAASLKMTAHSRTLWDGVQSSDDTHEALLLGQREIEK
jgi:hypothetical protein